MPFVVFDEVLLKLCRRHKILGNPGSIPIEFKLLVCLGILGRSSTADDMEKFCGLKERTVALAFNMFAINFASRIYDLFVSYPPGDALKIVTAAYSKMGLPLACGSMDATHVRLGKCPESEKTLCTGKEKYPSLAFQCIVGNNKL